MGAIRVCRVRAGGATKAALQAAYERFGPLDAIEVRGDDEATLRFAQREAAIKALQCATAEIGAAPPSHTPRSDRAASPAL